MTLNWCLPQDRVKHIPCLHRQEEPAPNRFFSQVLTHWALWSLGHPGICYPALLQTRSAKLSCLSLDGGRAWREASHQLRFLLAKSVKQIDFPPRPLGPSEQKETIFHLFSAQRAQNKNLQAGLEDAKCHSGHLQNFWMWPRTAMLYQCQLMNNQLWQVSLFWYKCIGLSASSLERFWRFCAWGGEGGYIPFRYTAVHQFLSSFRNLWKWAGL